ncbi:MULTISPECIES: dCMP deaminase [unclassified Brevibacterium]|uniref:dCMP deaminase n=1 Tax=unclassified Brevibacterium TaxID=2614124 RepID=UPI0010921905|nr:dCMP deaminase [Brevibacterium sp. S22]TGD31050.1 dCMP deaminase [Brevibacterium sp. S22]
MPEENDRAHASAAVQEALRSVGNARVGAVLARESEVLSTGHKGERPNLHAEEVAIIKAAEADIDVSGTALYTTLEPCANLKTNRVPCTELIRRAGIAVVHIGSYDPNPRIYRIGWKYLRDSGISVRDFPADLRADAQEAAGNFTDVFTKGIGMNGGAKFDFTQNGGRFTIKVDDGDGSPSWQTRWTNCGASAIYMYGGHAGIVALARYANEFAEIDDADALDYGGSSVRVDVGSIGVMRNNHGHVLCKVVGLEPTVDHGGSGHVSVTINWEVRLS